jgi:hypothetical protein
MTKIQVKKKLKGQLVECEQNVSKLVVINSYNFNKEKYKKEQKNLEYNKKRVYKLYTAVNQGTDNSRSYLQELRRALEDFKRSIDSISHFYTIY